MTSRRPVRWFLRAALAATASAAVACGEVPESTEQARGLLSGVNVALGLTIVFIVVAGGLIVGAVGFDRYMRARRALAEAPETAAEEEEDEDEDETEVVAGIGVGRAAVPGWLYGVYVVIPLFALLYVLNAVALRGPVEAEPEETPPPSGPVTEVTIVAQNIQFDLDEIVFPADTDVTVTFQNTDAGIPHDFTVWPDEQAATGGGESIAATPTFPGADEEDVTFNSDGTGSYYFNCTVHPSMSGTIEVVADGEGDEGGAEEAPAEA